MWPLIKILPIKTNFRFVAFAKAAGVVSALLCVASLAAVLFPFQPPCGGLNCGIDFRGGTILEFTTERTPGGPGQQIDLAKVRGALADKGLGDVGVQAFDEGKSVMVRFETPAGKDANAVKTDVRQTLEKTLGQLKFTNDSTVGAKVSGELFTNGILALLVAIGLMLIYIWFRFELQFGLGAVIGLFHDVLITFGLIALFDMEFSLTTIAAILTIIGYSMNDTVVVFDRLRENLRKYKKMPLKEVIDLSVNETLSRTIITGLTAILALGGLAVFGGEALFGFSVIMMFGIALGTYSSIYVAAPVILLWGVKRGTVEEEATPIKLGAASRP
ncbi:protein translocase subunit SecF [Caulobacter mirabilis]|uniref:Protein-export membrane protein SecF n=1 Tax=Caulobacter mirabilis TaxID=69666 RepID=A0A2D2AWU1_9CAUL|nr:protein translocase subunit SecF [Caulobacter mirabilis]ATQ42474.1 protein translocase subunit SecF [Caulobacter mirabilis]